MNCLTEVLAFLGLQMYAAAVEKMAGAGQFIGRIVDGMAADSTVENPKVDHLREIGRRFLRKAGAVI
jgi:hypothetical protein